MSEKNIMIVDTVEALEKRIEEVREAQRIFSTYSQEQVDRNLLMWIGIYCVRIRCRSNIRK